MFGMCIENWNVQATHVLFLVLDPELWHQQNVFDRFVFLCSINPID